MLQRVVLLFAIVLVTSGFTLGWSSSKPEAWDKWLANNAGNADPVDHRVWDEILQTYVWKDATGLNRFSYAKVTSADKSALKSYLSALSEIEITNRARPVQLAYWINLYNALTISVVLDNYPVDSIRQIDISGLLANGPWGKKLVTIEGVELTLDDIEHEILRPIWRDPRIHYAVNCASVGCPNLHRQAYTAQNIGPLLDLAANDFINHPRGVAINNGKITVSKIYKWFAYDFGNSEAGVLQHLAQYATPERAHVIRAIGRISDTEYDWSLNE